LYKNYKITYVTGNLVKSIGLVVSIFIYKKKTLNNLSLTTL